jgi:HD-GYP domain-containing protein (c-di-GMP phosphodiesterase class II)
MEAIAWLLGGFIAGALAREALAKAAVPASAPEGPDADEPEAPGVEIAERPELAAEIDELRRGATLERPLLVAGFHLDDFHEYSDLFGAAAGDALLDRLSAGLVAAMGERGTVHRTGPAEFTVVVPLDGEGPDRLLSVAAAALHAKGDGFSIGCSYGAVLLPLEAEDGREALRLAGHRLRDHRERRRAERERRGGDTLAVALRERDEDEIELRREIAELAEDTARKLGVPEGEVEQIRIAAGLHDVGKMAIPGVILNKPGPLDEREQRFVRHHTAIGERIVAAAPDLAQAAAIVRSIPERWDGSGYPDGLSGPRIPLGSRIVAVCSAYDAMTTTRPYRRAMAVQAVLAELRRFAGIQFDPDVVEAFCLALLDHPVERP